MTNQFNDHYAILSDAVELFRLIIQNPISIDFTIRLSRSEAQGSGTQ